MTAGTREGNGSDWVHCDWHNTIRADVRDLSLEFFQPVWIQPLLLTLQLMFVAVMIAAVVGIVGAWGASVLESGGRLGRWASRCFLTAMVVTLAIPMILHAAAWEATAGKFGWISMTQTGARSDATSAYGFFSGLIACGWIHGLFGGAIVALACWYGTRRVAPEVIDQSRLDLSPLGQWWRVRMPIASRWWITALVATAMLAAIEMTVVDLYGYRTLADEFYLIYAADPSIASVLATCAVPLAIVCSLLVWWSVSRRPLTPSRIPRVVNRLWDDQPTLVWRTLALVAAASVALTLVVVPMVGLLVKVGHQVVVEDGLVIANWSASACFQRILAAPRLFADEYGWTLLLALTTASIALVIAWPLASLSRLRPRTEGWLDISTIVLMVIPGPVVAMMIVSIFQWDVPGFRVLYQQTILPTVIALLARGIPVAYWVMRAAYRGVESSVLDAASLEMSWVKRMWAIDRPILSRNLTTAFLATAVVASGDVPAALPIIPPGVTTVGTRLFGLLHSGARYQEAALAIWYVAAITLISLFLLRNQTVRRIIK